MPHSQTPFMDLTFHVQTYGCQMNKHDSERVYGVLENMGATGVDTIEQADVVIFMTCCVREAADVRLYGQVASMKNLPMREGSPLHKRIVAVGGCIGQRDGEKLFEALPHLNVVFGTQNLASLPTLLLASYNEGTQQGEILKTSDDFSSTLPTTREHFWAAWLPITVGCNNYCTYCIVPHVRGKERSRTMEDIVKEAQHYVDAGVKEITLLGQNVNSYGRDLYGKPRFDDILEAVAQTGIERLRFATSHPKDLTDGVIDKFAHLENLMPYLHLPAQSGSNRVLKRMNRSYTIEHYRELIAKVKQACPGIALSTDIIVGFPGETEEDFQATYDLIDEMKYNQVFSFIYSKREGTPAARWDDPTPHDVIHARFDRLLEAVARGAHASNQTAQDTDQLVLVEGTSKRDERMLVGKTPHNHTTHFPLPENKTLDDFLGTIVNVHIDEAKTWYLKGHLIGQ